LLKCKNITKTYQLGIQQIEAVCPTTLEFHKGIHIIMGKSGSGKTTLLNILGGLEKPDSGEVLCDGKSLYRLKRSSQAKIRGNYLSFVFQFFNLVPEFNVYDNIALPFLISNRKGYKAEILSIARELSIQRLLNRMPAELSGGQQQRVAIARALVSQPEVILADEPTGNLDYETSIQIIKLFKKISKDKTAIIVTHDFELLKYGDYSYKMKDGKIKRCRVD